MSRLNEPRLLDHTLIKTWTVTGRFSLSRLVWIKPKKTKETLYLWYLHFLWFIQQLHYTFPDRNNLSPADLYSAWKQLTRLKTPSTGNECNDCWLWSTQDTQTGSFLWLKKTHMHTCTHTNIFTLSLDKIHTHTHATFLTVEGVSHLYLIVTGECFTRILSWFSLTTMFKFTQLWVLV